jgi:uncharacterized membrane protein (UPF0127 family)
VTASAPKAEQAAFRRLWRWDIITIGFGVVVIAAYILLYNFVITRSDTKDMVINGTAFNTEVTSSQADRERGLSGRDSLDPNTAMVFEFGDNGQHCMWMKDMKFAIDMVWFNESRKVVAVERNVTPKTYPKTFCHEGVTVIEFAAGTTDRVPFGIGDEIQ